MANNISFKIKDIKFPDNFFTETGITQQEFKEIQKYTKKISVQNLNNYTKENLSEIKRAAYDYIEKISKLATTTSLLNSLLRKRKKITNQLKSNENDTKLATALEEANEKIKEIILGDEMLKRGVIETHKFTAFLHDKLGKTLQMVYVHESEDGTEVAMYKINNIQDIISIQKGKAGTLEARLKLTAEKIANLEQASKKIQKIPINKEQAKNLDKTYSAIIERYNKYHYQGSLHIILWEMVPNKPKWHGLKRYQRGTLTQAYSDAVLNRRFQNFEGNAYTERESDIEFFATLVEKATGTFGALQSDVEYDNMSIAIKSGQASPQGIILTKKLAQAILNLPENIDEIKFLQVMRRYFQVDEKKLIEKVNNKTYQKYKEQWEKLAKT